MAKNKDIAIDNTEEFLYGRMSWSEMTKHDKLVQDRLGITDLIEKNKLLRAENVKLKAQLKSAKEDLKDKEISFQCVKAMLKTYLDFVDALDLDAEAFGKAMKKLNKP